MNVQILVDNKYRDLYSCYLVKRYVERHSGHRVWLSNKYDYKWLYGYLNPDIIILPHTHSYLSRAIPRFAENSDVYVMYTEGGYSSEVVLKVIHNDSEDGEVNRKYVRRAYVWGEAVKDTLLECGMFREDQLVASGNPRFDLYRVKSGSGPAGPKRCGIATTLRHLTSIHKIPLIRLVRHYSRLGGYDRSYWNDGGQFADFVWFEVATIELINRLFKEAEAAGREKRYYLRPHPFESPDAYRVFRQGNDVVIRSGESIIRMLDKVYVYIGAFTTSFTDALMHGVPCISIKRLYDRTRGELLIKKAIYAYGSDDLLWQPGSFDELFDMISKARDGHLALAPDTGKIKEYLRRHYNFYVGRTATQIIGDDLIKALSSRSRSNRRRSGRLLPFLAAGALNHATAYRRGDYNYSPLRPGDHMMLREVRRELDRVVSCDIAEGDGA